MATSEPTTSHQATVERGTEAIKSVVAKAGESGIHDLQVSLNEVDFLVKAAQIAASTIVHLDPTEQRLHKARLLESGAIETVLSEARTYLRHGF